MLTPREMEFACNGTYDKGFNRMLYDIGYTNAIYYHISNN